MLEKLISFSLRNKMIVLLFTLIIAIYGFISLAHLPIDSVPDITNNQVQVITVSPSLGASDIERQITFPLELSLSNIPGLVEQRSFSRFGLSIITLVFHDETDVYWARQQVSERLLLIDLPMGSGKPFLAPVSTGLGEIYQYVVKPKKGYEDQYTITELRTIQDWIVRRNLLGTEGVAEVSSFGGKLKQYVIEINPEKLAGMNISVSEIKKALQNNNANSGGGYLTQGNSLLVMRTEGLLNSVEDIENIVIKVLPNSIPVKIRDIANVDIGFALRYGALSFNGEREVAGGIVMMLKGENSNSVVEKVKKKVEKIQAMLPEGIEIEPFLDRTKMVNNAIHTVSKNLIEGALIVIFILVVFLGTFRAGFVVASVIPLSMLIAVILMNLFGVSGNLMSLGALDFGLIVDGAVIVVEALMHRLHRIQPVSKNKLLNSADMDKEVLGISNKMMNAAVFGQIIIMMVYVPILSLEGIEGKMFKPMAQTVAFAIFGAFLLSITYVPVVSSILLNKKAGSFKWMEKTINRLENGYINSLQLILKKSKWFIAISLMLFILSMVLLSKMGGEFIPELEEGDFAVETRMLPGTNLETVVQSTQKAAALLKNEFIEVEKVVVKTGSAEIPTDPMPVEASDLMVILKPKEEWKNAETFDGLAEKMSERLKSIPELSTGFQYPVQMRFNELISGAKQDVVCKIFGDNLDSLSSIAAKIGDAIYKVDGLRDLYVEAVLGLPQMVIRYDKTALSRFGVSVSELNETVNTLFAGDVINKIYENDRSFDLTVKIKNRDNSNLLSIGNIPIRTGNNTFIPLKELAKIEFQNGPVQIQREDAKRRISIGFNVRGRDVETVVNEVSAIIKRNVKLPEGYTIVYGGQFENLNAAKARLGIALPVALAVILLLLFFSFGSIKYSILVFSAIPLSSIGGILSLWLRGMPFSISAGIGFIALFGVAVLNGIVLMTEFIFLKKNSEMSSQEIVFSAAKSRLRPVVMTALVASLGFLPMAISTSPGSEVQRPLATVVIGGLVTSTFLTLYMLPALFNLFETRKKKKLTVPMVVVLFCLLSIGENMHAQVPNLKSLSLNQVLDRVEKNHPLLKSSKERLEQLKLLEKAVVAIPKTEFSYERGNINSAFTDTKWGVSQAFEFPIVYSLRKRMEKLNTQVASNEMEISQIQLQFLVKAIYAKALHWKISLEIFSRADSLFNVYYNRVKRAVDLGELNVLQKLSAEQLMGDWKNRLSQAEFEYINALQQLKICMVSDSLYTVQNDVYFENENLPTKDAELGLTFQVFQNKLQLADIDRKTQVLMLVPEFKLGYYNQSITGFVKNTDGNEIFYNRTNRFNVLSAGLFVPIFFQSDLKKIQSMKHYKNFLQYQLEEFRLYRNNKLEQARNLFLSVWTSKNTYDTRLVPAANEIIRISLESFSKGEINYLEWTILNQQAFEILLKHQMIKYNLIEAKLNFEELITN